MGWNLLKWALSSNNKYKIKQEWELRMNPGTGLRKPDAPPERPRTQAGRGHLLFPLSTLRLSLSLPRVREESASPHTPAPKSTCRPPKPHSISRDQSWQPSARPPCGGNANPIPVSQGCILTAPEPSRWWALNKHFPTHPKGSPDQLPKKPVNWQFLDYRRMTLIAPKCLKIPFMKALFLGRLHEIIWNNENLRSYLHMPRNGNLKMFFSLNIQIHCA